MPIHHDNCVRCHPRGPGDPPITRTAPSICDACMEAVNHPTPARLPVVLQHPISKPDGRKSSKRRGRKTKTVATALAFLLLPFTGCTIHHECTLDFELEVPTLPPAAVLAPTEP